MEDCRLTVEPFCVIPCRHSISHTSHVALIWHKFGTRRLPYSWGIVGLTRPSACAFLITGHGNSPERSYSAARGTISSRANCRAVSRNCLCSSLRSDKDNRSINVISRYFWIERSYHLRLLLCTRKRTIRFEEPPENSKIIKLWKPHQMTSFGRIPPHFLSDSHEERARFGPAYLKS